MENSLKRLLSCSLVASGLLFCLGPTATGSSFHYLTNEAESGSITRPMARYAGSQAFGGRYVWISPSNLAPGNGKAEYSFSIPTNGLYDIWCRVRAPSEHQDSFRVAVDGGSEEIYDVAEGRWSDDWQWTRVNGRQSMSDPRQFVLAQGEHTLRFRGREINNEETCGLDRFIITNDLLYDPNNPNPLPGLAYVPMEAEDATLITAPMRIELDPPASGGDYVWLPWHQRDAGLASYLLEIPAGDDYVVWCRVRAPSAEQDSFYVSVSDSGGGTVLSTDIYDVVLLTISTSTPNSDYWQWTRVNGRGSVAYPRTFSSGGGNHRIDFGGRELYVAMDRFIITNDPDFRPETRPEITSITTTGGTATVSWTASIGTSYRLEYKPTLSGVPWVDLVETITSDGSTAIKTVGLSSTEGYYRLRVLP